MTEPKQVIVMRKDLGMRKGKMCAQAAHASMKVVVDQFIATDGDAKYTWVLSSDEDALAAWLHGRFTKICVSVSSEEDLDRIHAAAYKAGLPCALIVDAGLTEFGGVPTKTCCAIGPDDPGKIDAITGDSGPLGRLPLL